jgi:hypothetical protein
VADQHEQAVPADGGFDKSPQNAAMCRKAVSIGAGVLEFVGNAHPNQIRRDTSARLCNFRHDVAPQERGGRVAVQKEENRLAAAELDIGHALAVDGEELLGVWFDAMRSGHRRFLRATVSHDSFDLFGELAEASGGIGCGSSAGSRSGVMSGAPPICSSKRLHLMAEPQAAAPTALKAARCKVTNSCTVIGR